MVGEEPSEHPDDEADRAPGHDPDEPADPPAADEPTRPEPGDVESTAEPDEASAPDRDEDNAASTPTDVAPADPDGDDAEASTDADAEEAGGADAGASETDDADASADDGEATGGQLDDGDSETAIDGHPDEEDQETATDGETTVVDDDPFESGFFGGSEGPEDDREMPLAEHIEEMLKRLAVVIAVAGVVSLVVLPFAIPVVNFLWYSIMPGAAGNIARPRLYGILELWFVRVKVASLAGLIVALPVLVYETYAFMRPGLYPNERRYYLAAVPTSLVLALVGVSFAFFVVPRPSSPTSSTTPRASPSSGSPSGGRSTSSSCSWGTWRWCSRFRCS